MEKTLQVVLTQCRNKQPLALVRNLPGSDVEMRPEQMMALAKALLEAAGDAASAPMGVRTFSRQSREYDLTPLPTDSALSRDYLEKKSAARMRARM